MEDRHNDWHYLQKETVYVNQLTRRKAISLLRH